MKQGSRGPGCELLVLRLRAGQAMREGTHTSPWCTQPGETLTHLCGSPECTKTPPPGLDGGVLGVCMQDCAEPLQMAQTEFAHMIISRSASFSQSTSMYCARHCARPRATSRPHLRNAQSEGCPFIYRKHNACLKGHQQSLGSGGEGRLPGRGQGVCIQCQKFGRV